VILKFNPNGTADATVADPRWAMHYVGIHRGFDLYSILFHIEADCYGSLLRGRKGQQLGNERSTQGDVGDFPLSCLTLVCDDAGNVDFPAFRLAFFLIHPSTMLPISKNEKQADFTGATLPSRNPVALVSRLAMLDV